MISAIIYYLVSASAVLYYGIGLDKTISSFKSFSSSLLSCIKAMLTASSTTAVSYILMNWLLVSIGLSELYPFIAALIFILFTSLIEIFVDIGIRQAPTEFAIPLLSVFLGLGEGVTMGSAVIISCTCILSFYAMLILFYCVKDRVSFYTTESGLKTYCVLLLSLALIMLAISGFNTSWLNIYLGDFSN